LFVKALFHHADLVLKGKDIALKPDQLFLDPSLRGGCHCQEKKEYQETDVSLHEFRPPKEEFTGIIPQP
jgi:hypothetical protein